MAGGPGQRKEGVGSVSSLRLVLAQRSHGLIGPLASSFEEVSELRNLFVGDSGYRRIGKKGINRRTEDAGMPPGAHNLLQNRDAIRQIRAEQTDLASRSVEYRPIADYQPPQIVDRQVPFSSGPQRLGVNLTVCRELVEFPGNGHGKGSCFLPS